MAVTYDINTLLPVESIQRITQLYGSPAFSDKGNHNSASYNRAYYVHLMTGRVPTPAEFYYGIYVDHAGQSHKSLALNMAQRALGFFAVRNDGYTDGSTSTLEQNLKSNGAGAPDGITFSSRSNYFSPVARDPNSDFSWLIDWSFSAAHLISLTGNNNRSVLTSYQNANELVEEARPTWFYLSEDDNPFPDNNTYVDHPTDNNVWTTVISSVDSDQTPERYPIVMGTAGKLGSGADLELSVGGDSITNQIQPVSLRIQCNPVVS